MLMMKDKGGDDDGDLHQDDRATWRDRELRDSSS